MQEVAVLIASMVLTNAVLTDNHVEATRAWVGTKLKVPFASLPGVLKTKLGEHTSGKKKAGDSKAAAATSAESAQPTVEAGEAPNKFRRLSCRAPS